MSSWKKINRDGKGRMWRSTIAIVYVPSRFVDGFWHGICVALYDFTANGQHQVNLQESARVSVEEEHSGWYRGTVYLPDAPIHGIFPAAYVHLDELRGAEKPPKPFKSTLYVNARSLPLC